MLPSELAQYEEPAIQKALAKSFDANGRKGWKHTEIDRWLWDRERKPSLSLELIDRNLAEFERYGGVSIAPTPLQTAGGVQVVRIALLNFKQALCYCNLSDAPRAVDVRQALIVTFCDAVTGQLQPQTDGALAQQAQNDRLAEAITSVAIKVGEFAEAARKNHEAIENRFAGIEGDLAGIRDRLRSFEEKDRKNPKSSDLSIMHKTVHECHTDKCPNCQLTQIIGDDGRRLESWNVDHANGKWDNRLESLWPVCAACNQRLRTEAGYRSKREHRFKAFQENIELCRPTQLRLM